MSISLGSKNSAVGILLTLNLVYFGAWLGLQIIAVYHPALNQGGILDKVFGVFEGVNGALLLILNAEAKNGPDLRAPTPAPNQNPQPPHGTAETS